MRFLIDLCCCQAHGKESDLTKVLATIAVTLERSVISKDVNSREIKFSIPA